MTTGAAPPARGLSLWLYAVAAVVAMTVLVGGATRITDSGLSITRWTPLTGILPPLDSTDWARAFADYKKIPEYAQVNQNMTLSGFKRIYWWEWTHRIMGRLTGMVFILPFLWFWMSGRLPRRLTPPLLTVGVLIGVQGLLGWIMVRSGLTTRIDVAPPLLAAHLGLAFIIFGAVLWLVPATREKPPAPPSIAATSALALTGLILVQVTAGGFVAGLHGGLLYNTWPLMQGGFFPADMSVDSPGAAQFIHRLLAWMVLLLAAFHVWRLRRHPSPLITGAVLVFLLAVAQSALGISTLLLTTPPSLALAHQGGALLVFLAAVVHARRCCRGVFSDSASRAGVFP